MNPHVIQWLAIVICAVASSLPAYASFSHRPQIRIGVLQHDTKVWQTRIEPGTDINLEWDGSVHALPSWLQLYPGFGIRPELGYTGNFGGARTEEVYAAIGFDLLPSPSWELRVSGGFAAHEANSIETIRIVWH